jgi:hypothetical protein
VRAYHFRDDPACSSIGFRSGEGLRAIRSCRATPRCAGGVLDPALVQEALSSTHRGRCRSQEEGRPFGAISVGRFCGGAALFVRQR